MKKSFGLFLVAGLFSLNAFGWGPNGHRTVAEIAQRHLEPAVLQKVKDILGGQDLADVANWADEIRGDARYKSISPLHYADVSSNYKRYEDAPKVADGDVVVAISTLTDYLKSGDAGSLSRLQALASINRVQALKLLVHFVGDVHQPLHVGDPADQGGNKVAVNWMNKWTTNLHSIWDDEMIDLERLSYNDYASFLERHYRGHEKEWSGGTPVAWADESMALRADAYVFPDKQPAQPGSPVFISYNYVDKSRDVIRRRLYQGGVRLAALLNSIFASK